MGRLLLVSSPKGGSGKSVLARHLLVSAAQAGIDVAGIDYDRQATLLKWAQARDISRQKVPELHQVTVRAATLKDWRKGVQAKEALLIADTPPSVEDHMSAISNLAAMADLIVVPCQPTHDDVGSVKPWVEALVAQKRRVIIVLNRANRRTTSFGKMRGQLLEVADVCPVEIPQLEDVHVPAADGLTVLDYSKSRGLGPMSEVWRHISRMMSLV